MNDATITQAPQIHILITFDPSDGNINIQTSALPSKMFMYGILESVRDMLRAHYANAEQPNIVVPFPRPVPSVQ